MKKSRMGGSGITNHDLLTQENVITPVLMDVNSSEIDYTLTKYLFGLINIKKRYFYK